MIDIKKLSEKLNFSSTRFPYTYHHDFVRSYTNKNLSRGEVSMLFNKYDLDDPYFSNIAFIFLLSIKNGLSMMEYSEDELIEFKKGYEFASKSLETTKKVLKDAGLEFNF